MAEGVIVDEEMIELGAGLGGRGVASAAKLGRDR